MRRRHMGDGSGEVDFVDFSGLKKFTVQTIDFADELFYLADFIHVVAPQIQAAFLVLA